MVYNLEFQLIAYESRLCKRRKISQHIQLVESGNIQSVMDCKISRGRNIFNQLRINTNTQHDT
jgi:hypothetical protein